MRKPIIVAVAALTLLLAGCAEETPGTPKADDAGPTGASTAQPTTEAPTSESETPAGPSLTDTSPCDLADSDARSALGLTGGEEKSIGEARVCRFRKDGATLNDSFTVSVEIFDTLGLADIVSSDIQQLPKIGDHDASRFTDPTGSCTVSLGVTEKSRVDAAAVGGEQQQGCAIAEQLATIVERKLP